MLVTDLEGAFLLLAFPEGILHLSEEAYPPPAEGAMGTLRSSFQHEPAIDKAGHVSNVLPFHLP